MNNNYGNNNNNNNNNNNRNNNNRNNNNRNNNNQNNNNNNNNQNNNRNNNRNNNTNRRNERNKTMEKNVETALKDTLACQDATQVFIVQATHVDDVNVTIDAVHRAMEVSEACSLFKFFLINKSPNLKASVVLTEMVIKSFQDDLYELRDHKCCRDVVAKTINVNKSFLKSLAKLKKL